MSKKYKRHFLKEREAKALLNEASEKLKVDLEKVFRSEVKVELVKMDFGEVFLLNGKPSLFKIEGNLYPTLLFEEIFELAPRVVVDMGAVRYICNGANVMAPGIVRFEGDFRKGDLVFVVDEKYGKPIAVGEVFYDSADAVKVKQGVVVKNVHFVGDKIWKSLKELL
jgi:PUA domain protein